MKALVFRHSLAREAVGKIAGVVSPRAFVAPIAPIALLARRMEACPDDHRPASTHRAVKVLLEP
jgi:hypothetical protein